MARLPAADLDWVLEQAEPDLSRLRGERLFITGGTGFIGSWLVECLLHANQRMQLNLELLLLTRSPAAFAARLPHLAEDTAIRTICGDARELQHTGETAGLAIHAATDASARLNRENPLLMADTIVEGTRRTLEFCRQAGVRRMLMLSSGAVYGRLEPGLEKVEETYRGGPDPLDPYYTYSESKRMAELLCALYARQYGLEVPVARLFAFLGPRLPLDEHFAAGNFLRDCLDGGPIRVGGDGTAVRSYQYAAELVVWLLAILLRGESASAYNVGSGQGVSIGELARTMAALHTPPLEVVIAGRADASNPVNYYVPNVARARDELGLTKRIPLEDALRRSLSWLRNGEPL